MNNKEAMDILKDAHITYIAPNGKEKVKQALSQIESAITEIESVGTQIECKLVKISNIKGCCLGLMEMKNKDVWLCPVTYE